MDKKRTERNLVWVLLLVAGTVWILARHNRPAPYQRDSGLIFGTVYNITYQHDSTLKADIEAELRRFDGSLSPFNDTSVITRVNRGEEVAADSLFRNVFRRSMQISAETDGAFDITVAPLVNAWGFGFKNESHITPTQIDSLLQFVGFRKIDFVNGKIIKQDPRVILDCSAVAKGYGSDVIARTFDRKGIANYMVEIGGEIVVKGVNPKGEKWKVGINKPVEDSLGTAGGVQTILNLTDVAVATSGNYRNFYYRDGKKYAHTIDPHSGYPVQHSILSSTVLAKDCATADAYATAFMVLGLDASKEVLEAHPEIQAYFIYADEKGENQTDMTPGVKALTAR